MTRKSAGTSLESAQEALTATTALIADLEAQRRAALLGDDDGVVSRLSNRLEGLRRQRQTDLDRVTARFEVAEKELQAKAAAERSTLIARIEGIFVQRDEAGRVLAEHVKAADKSFLRVLALGKEIADAWEWGEGDLMSTLCSPASVLGVLRNEIFRIGGRISPGGGMPNPHPGPSYPGAQPERLEFAMLPSKFRPLTERFAEASAVASQIMKTGRHDPVPEPAPIAVPVAPDVMPMPAPAQVSNGHAVPTPGNVPVPTIGSAEQLEFSMLVARNAALVEGPQTEAAEKEYRANLKRIEKLQATFQ
jgi:hypothetical protein